MMVLPDRHLTYCTNIHPGETWKEVFANISTYVLAVKQKVCPQGRFGVGLRLSAEAAGHLAEPAVLDRFRAFLADQDLYVFTINGFPYGTFHGQAIKERVYRPDWLEDDRLRYSDQLAELLAALLPTDVDGSVSTVPGCFRPRGDLPEARVRMADNLRRHVAGLVRLRERTGRTVGLALEPEPHCVIETTQEALSFFEEHLLTAPSLLALGCLIGTSASAAEQALRRHLGLCLDTCHAAVEFENPAEILRSVEAAGVCVLKVQVTAGLRVLNPDPAKLAALRRFDESIYLHQVVVRRGATLTRYADLPEALTAAETAADSLGDEWRIHFHVPLFHEQLGPFLNTQGFAAEWLSLIARRQVTQHLEVETYTWDVLPAEYRGEPVVDAIARELAWVRSKLATA
jgi:sugar phosphate isomerase/epimerase